MEMIFYISCVFEFQNDEELNYHKSTSNYHKAKNLDGAHFFISCFLYATYKDHSPYSCAPSYSISQQDRK